MNRGQVYTWKYKMMLIQSFRFSKVAVSESEFLVDLCSLYPCKIDIDIQGSCNFSKYSGRILTHFIGKGRGHLLKCIPQVCSLAWHSFLHTNYFAFFETLLCCMQVQGGRLWLSIAQRNQ